MSDTEKNPADVVLAAYQRADLMAAWCFDMMHRCQLVNGRTPAELLSYIQDDTFDRQFEYAFFFPDSDYRPPLASWLNSL